LRGVGGVFLALFFNTLMRRQFECFLNSETEQKMYREPFLIQNFLVDDTIRRGKLLELTKIFIKNHQYRFVLEGALAYVVR
jgi:hypothetical protein